MGWQSKRLTRDQLTKRRAEAVRLLEAGEMKQVEIAHELGITEAAISQWKRKLKEQGGQALERRESSGRPPKLRAANQQALKRKLEKVIVGLKNGVFQSKADIREQLD